MANKIAWKVLSWAEATDLSKSTVYEMIQAKELETIKYGGARLITTSPADWIAKIKAQAEAEASKTSNEPLDLSKFIGQ